VVLIGELTLWEQDGGYASPSVLIGSSDIGTAVEEMIQRENIALTAGAQGRADGQWVLTLVRYAVDGRDELR